MKAVIALCVALLAAPGLLWAKDIRITVRDANGPLAGVVVALTGAEPVKPVQAEIYQKDRQFHPQLLIVPVGSRVDFPNRDNTQHQVYSFSPAKPFNLKLYADRPAAPIVFDKPGIVELGCNIHDRMQAFILVTSTSDIGQTDADGRITLSAEAEDMVDGRVPVTLWHPRLADTTHPVKRTVDPNTPADLTLELTPEPVRDNALDRLQRRFQDL